LVNQLPSKPRIETVTLPFEYQNPTLQFERFMVDARDCAGLPTTNMAWNMVVGVLHAFRWRLSVNQALSFAAVLPPMVRAVFIEDWNPEQAVVPFGEPADWLADVRSVRARHNFSPPNAVTAAATALRRHVNADAFERVLAVLPAEASHYWQPQSTSSNESVPGAA
jgi:uncharacterized protein (DUF2267 family)